ncbi:ABC transporter ATP-binding protein [Paucilactobacillus suebicus]|nr:ABC transporter ATP-binding protein [Paucilactobacillus suebicus]
MSVLTMDGIYKTFGSGHTLVTALTDVNLSVNAGEFISIIGPSGSGKSTFLTIAGGLQSPSRGTIKIDNLNLTKLNDRQKNDVRFNNIGFVLQSSNLIPFLTVADQFKLVEKLSHQSLQQRSEALLKSLDIWDLKDKYPKELSGGERQRVAIARALCHNPNLILADEPTASLDSDHAYEVVKILATEAHKNKKAIIMVTHDERMTKWSDRVYRIRDGHFASA